MFAGVSVSERSVTEEKEEMSHNLELDSLQEVNLQEVDLDVRKKKKKKKDKKKQKGPELRRWVE